MLVLGRREGESLTLATKSGEVVVTLGQARPGQVRLGVDAPDDVTITRSEIQESPTDAGARV